MVIYNGYCRPLKSKVDFEVSEVNAIDTSRGVKWQIKGNYDSHKISVFAKESVAKELEAKLIKPDFFEAHTDTIVREPKIHEVPLSQELDEPMMAFDAEEIKIYDSEELAPFSTFNAEVFDAYDNYGVMEEEEEIENPQWNTLRTIKDFEASLLWFFGSPLHPDNEDQKADNSFPVVIYDYYADPAHSPITDITYSDEFDSIYLIGEVLEEGSEWDEVVNKSITIKQAYDKLKRILRTVAPEEISGFKVKYGEKVYDPETFEPQSKWEGSEEGYGLLIYPPDADDDYSNFNLCEELNVENIKHTYVNNPDANVYMFLVDTDDCDDVAESCAEWRTGNPISKDLHLITSFDNQHGEDDYGLLIYNLRLEKQTQGSFDTARPTSSVRDLYELFAEGANGYINIVGMPYNETYNELIEDEELREEVCQLAMGGQWSEGALVIGIERQNLDEALAGPVDYSNLKVVELKELLEDRGLTKSGKKADLIARLEEDDDDDMGEMIDIDDATDEGMALTYDELNEFLDERIEDGLGDEYAYLSTQFIDGEGDRATTATVIVQEDEDEPYFIGTAVPEIPLSGDDSYCEDCGEEWEDCFCEEEDDDEDYEAEDSTSITHTKEAESSPFTTDIGFITFHSSETSQEVGEDDGDIIPMIFDKFIPPEVWGDLKDSQQQKFITTGDESILKCPKCGLTKAELRSNDGNCSTTDPMSEAYVAKLDCPYSKHFAPMHWIDNKESNITKTTKKAMNNVYFDDDAPIEVMAAEDVFHAPNRHSQPAHDGVKSILISKAEYYSAIHSIPETVSAVESNDGTSMKLGYFESESNIVEGLFTDTLMSEDRTPTSFSAESNELPILWAEDLNDFKPLGRDSVVMLSENYGADENSKVVDKYDYYRNIMDIGDEDEIVDSGDSVIIKNNDIMEPDNEIKSTICVGCETEFKKVNMLDKKGMCFNCGEESINLSQLQRYKGGGIATFDESEYPNEVMIDEEEVDNYMDDDELTEDGYSMFEEDYEEWNDDYESESDYTSSQPLNSHKWLIGALGLGGIAVLLVPEKISKLFKRK